RLTGGRESLTKLAEGTFEISLNVVVQRLEGRHVQDVHRVRQRRLHALDDEPIELPEKRRERFSRARRCQDECVRSGRDRRPTLELRRAGRAKRVAEPRPYEAMEWLERGRGTGHWEKEGIVPPEMIATSLAPRSVH